MFNKGSSNQNDLDDNYYYGTYEVYSGKEGTSKVGISDDKVDQIVKNSSGVVSENDIKTVVFKVTKAVIDGEDKSSSLKENAELQQRVESLETSSLRSTLQSASCKTNDDFSKILELPVWTNFKVLPGIVKETFSDKSVLVFTAEWNYLIITDWSVSAKELAKKYNLRGGGSDVMAQWKDESVKSI